MLEQLRCPNTICRAQLDEFDVAGETGYCPKCGECFRVTNGTLALTNKYGLDIPDLTQKRIDCELAVFREHERNCRGKLEDCKERLQWSTEKYAALPQPPAYLEVKKFNDDKWRGYAGVAFSTMGVAFLLAIPMSYLAYHIGYVNKNFGFGHGWGTWV